MLIIFFYNFHNLFNVKYVLVIYWVLSEHEVIYQKEAFNSLWDSFVLKWGTAFGLQKEKKGLLKLLSGASAKRKPRLSPPASPTLEAEQAAAELALQGAVGPELPSAGAHSKAGSCPTEGEAPGLAQETLQRKGAALDTAVPIAPPPRQPCSSLGPVLNESRPLVCER